MFLNAGVICLNSFVSPTKAIRKQAQTIIGEDNFIEIFVNTPLDICEKRDVKGLYKKARKGEIKNFTGIDAPFEQPVHPQVEVKTEHLSIEESVDKVYQQVIQHINY